jgi:hypothetical protein
MRAMTPTVQSSDLQHSTVWSSGRQPFLHESQFMGGKNVRPHLNDNRITLLRLYFVETHGSIFLRLRWPTSFNIIISVKILALFFHHLNLGIRQKYHNGGSFLITHRRICIWYILRNIHLSKNCSDRCVFPKRLVICHPWFLSTGNITTYTENI